MINIKFVEIFFRLKTMTDEISLEVFIKNIPYSINERDLSEWCSSFGPVTKCIVVRDRFGNSRGFAFVTYATIEGHNKICKSEKTYLILCNNKFHLEYIFSI
jgi:RNA recognition motif-containing protein